MDRKRVRAYIILIMAVGSAGFLALSLTRRLLSGDVLQAYCQRSGRFGWLFAVGLQTAQILLAFIPGELVESGLGYAFGAFYGTVYCYLGLLIGQGLVFFMVRRFGGRVLGYFVSPDKLSALTFLKSEKRLHRLAFLLFLLPGTPKDLFCFLFPLTSIGMKDFLLLSLVARFPSVITSTVGGNMLAGGDLRSAVVLYGITGALSLLGMWLYNCRKLKFNV